MTEWQEFWNSDCGRQFIEMLQDRFKTGLESLVSCENFDVYKEKVGYIKGIQDILALLEELKEVETCS